MGKDKVYGLVIDTITCICTLALLALALKEVWFK